jgi:2-keto-4-pentenoate hydratase/2-oxohepta-3-ene-1,7-dioic acid hydratase in catechol pathway
MKLVRFGESGKERPGVIDSNGSIRDLSEKVSDFEGENVSLGVISKIRDIDIESLPLIAGSPRIGACLQDVPNFYCIGLNYTKHAIETGMDIPKEPILFSKATSAISGPFDKVIIPKNSKKSDWEVELGIIIGKECEHVAEEDALTVISGYCTINDVSEREFQAERGGQWIKGKSAPTFGPIGPYFVTADEISDPQNLEVELSLNGKIVQKSNTSDMIFSVTKIISYMTQFMKLRAGDIIASGTPSGVGMGMKPPQFLKPGDIMEIEVQGCGRQRQEAVSYPG